MAGLKCINMNKIYENQVKAVRDFSLEIEDGEFIVLVGPSGCGKSTLLRMISGLESITSGDLYIGERRVNQLAPSDRDIAMVFQNYALYGNMTVYENMGFSLIIRHQNNDVMHKKVMEAADIVGLKTYLNRKPANLSGGQRQRVALGRSIVRDAQVFLLDEPLSNLDAKLRHETRKELVKLHRQLKTTFIYVTHDQIEAMTMADRMVIMKDGVVQQVGTPVEVYSKPENMFVAGFIGSPPMNFIEGIIKDGQFSSDSLSFKLDEMCYGSLENYENKAIILGIRPEDLFEERPELSDDVIYSKIMIDVVELLGSEMWIHFEWNASHIVGRIEAQNHIHYGSELTIGFSRQHIHFFDPSTTARIELGGL